MAQGPGQAIALESLQAPFLDCASPARLAACDAAMSKNFRRGLDRRRRRLDETGSLEFAVIDDPAGFAALLDWTIASKVEWLDRRGLKTPFLRSDHYRAFWLAVHASASGGGRVRGMALRLDGQIIAAKIVVQTPGRLEGFLTTFDPEFSRFSPGQILLRETFAWCAEAGLAYDFRIGDEAYKLDWTSAAARVTNYVLPLSRAGALLHRTRMLRRQACAVKDRLRERIPTGLRRVLKSLLRDDAQPTEA